jgi:hypothetical protein
MRLATSANIVDFAVDVRIFIIKGLLRERRRGNFLYPRLAVAHGG